MEEREAKVYRLGVVVYIVMGIFLIIYSALGVLYVQQGPKQKELSEQVAKLDLVVSKPLPSVEKLKAEYDEANRSFASLTAGDAIKTITNIAKESGIDVDPGSDKLNITTPKVKTEKVGGGKYPVLSFTNIGVQGDYNNVVAFVSNLDSGKTLKTMVLKRIVITEVVLKGSGEDKPMIESAASLDVDIYTKTGK